MGRFWRCIREVGFFVVRVFLVEIRVDRGRFGGVGRGGVWFFIGSRVFVGFF